MKLYQLIQIISGEEPIEAEIEIFTFKYLNDAREKLNELIKQYKEIYELKDDNIEKASDEVYLIEVTDTFYIKFGIFEIDCKLNGQNVNYLSFK